MYNVCQTVTTCFAVFVFTAVQLEQWYQWRPIYWHSFHHWRSILPTEDPPYQQQLAIMKQQQQSENKMVKMKMSSRKRKFPDHQFFLPDQKFGPLRTGSRGNFMSVLPLTSFLWWWKMVSTEW